MDPRGQFANLEIMSRERAMWARREAEHWLAEAAFWQTEAEEWRQLKEAPAPSLKMTKSRAGLVPSQDPEIE
jgi:hypothetical protein